MNKSNSRQHQKGILSFRTHLSLSDPKDVPACVSTLETNSNEPSAHELCHCLLENEGKRTSQQEGQRRSGGRKELR